MAFALENYWQRKKKCGRGRKYGEAQNIQVFGATILPLMEDCGFSKGCWSDVDLGVAVSYQAIGQDLLSIELAGTSDLGWYIALGFSEDQQMVP